MQFPEGFPQPATAPQGAPNVLLVMTDDVGFGATSPFGGPVPMPCFERLANTGLRYNRFHTTAMCSPTRASLLTGRNPHNVNAGVIVEAAYGNRGYTSVLPDGAGTIGQVLSANGYDTAWLGKNHNTPLWETTSLGPFDRWPNGYGFDYFYGFMGGATDQFRPGLVENRNPVEPPDDPDYILDRDLADKALTWLRRQHTLAPDRPFLMYMAPGTAHSPHQAPREWIDRFRGRFDAGWDALREETFERQRALGIVPPGARLTPRPDRIPAWDSFSADEQRLFARMMEAAAGMLAHWDHQFSRVIDHLEETGQLDNTLVIYVQGDNGASGEGGLTGTTNELGRFNGLAAGLDHMLAHIDDIGGPDSFGNYPVGWAWAMNAPFQWTKQVASHFGGTRNGMVVSWPARIAGGGEVRSQFHHVIDIAPTIYEAAGITPPDTLKGVRQMPIDGVSMVYSFASDAAEGTRRGQYFELGGHRAYYLEGWIGSTYPDGVPWQTPSTLPAGEWRWELYDLSSDYSQYEDLAARHPDKLAEIRDRFAEACRAFHVGTVRSNPQYGVLQPKPGHFRDRTHFTYYPSGRRLFGSEFPDFRNRSWSVRAVCDFAAQAEGAIIVQGGWVGGWALYADAGQVRAAYRASDAPRHHTCIAAPSAPAAGPHEVMLDFRYDGNGVGQGGRLSLHLDGVEMAVARVAATIGRRMSGAEGASIGFARGTPVIPELTGKASFNGRIERIDVALG